MKEERIAYLAFTKQGRELAARLCDALGGAVFSLEEGMTLDAFAKKAFAENTAIVFVCAMGIAVRAIAPYIKDKTKDPAVVVIDERHCT